MPIVGWRRVTSPGACDFCTMIASRGTVYSTEESASFEAHAPDELGRGGVCACSVEPVWRKQADPPAVQALKEQWNQVTEGLSGVAARLAWRKYWRGRDQGAGSTVPELTPAEARRVQRVEIRARFDRIQRADGTAKLLAEIDELLHKKASVSVIRQRLDDALIAPEQLFANADPAVMATLRQAASDPTKLRAAVTKLSGEAGLSPVSRAGARVAFDPDTMDPVGGDIAPGVEVTVVRRGASVTLPDGSTVQLSKARVTRA